MDVTTGVVRSCYNLLTVVSRANTPPPPLFCNLSLSTKRRGAYKRDATFSLAITPPPPPSCRNFYTVGSPWSNGSARTKPASTEP